MSRRKRRKSCRRKSSSSSKQSISPYNFQKHTKNLVDTVVHGEETAEKGETDSFCKENTLSESEEEKESPSKEKKNRRGSYKDIFQEKNKKASVSEQVDRDTDLKITHSVTVDNFGLSSPRVVFERCHETSVDGTVSSVIAITTTEVRCMTSNMRLEINEVVTLNDSDFKTTLILQNDRQKGVQTKFKTQTEKHQNPKTTCFSPWNQNGVDHKQNVNHHGNVSYKISIAELSAKHNDAGSSQSSWDCPEDWDCHKSCCKNNFCGESTGGQTDTDFTLVDGSSCSSSASDFWQPQKQLSLPTSLSNDALWNIPPPDEFADEKDDVLDDLAENVALFQISHKKDFNDHEDSESTHTASEDFSCCKEFMYQNSLDGDKMKNDEICCGSGLSPQEQLFMSRTVSINRSSFTKNFIHNHERRTKLRNNSIGIIETKTHSSSYMDIPRKRRKTFPAMSYHLSQGRESIPSHRESFSSGTLYSFFMHSLPFQAERMGRFCVEDERLCLFGAESRKSSSSSSYGPSSSSTTGLDCFPKLKAYSTIKNPFYPSRSDESPEEVFFRGEQYYEPQQDKDFEVSDATMFMDGADADNNLAGPQEQNEVNESGFDEEMIEVDETIPDGDTLDSQKNFLIHIIPPSPCNSEEHINEGVANKLRSNTCEEEKGEVGQKRRGSVLTIITGDCEQRFIHVNSPDEGVSQEDQIDAFSTKCDSPIVSFTQNLEMDNTREPMIEGISQAQEIKISEDCLSEESTVSVVQLNTSFQQPEEDITGELINDNQKMDNVGENAQVQRNKVSNQINEASDKVSADLCRTHMLYKNDLSERHNGSKCSLEVKEHLRPPADSIHKDSEENSDRWAKRRKLFKESKQRSSAGGSSITSNITEESDTINSEDTRSVDILMQDIEERGFYTEIFHSASWIYRGDDVTQNDGPNCLSNRARPAAIRERTVKIGKGMGDYPWGFRIQFSKPIVVTEVDTNGAAEEAGLQVGDYVLAVNGTDVTSVPHSEAADLARQGPDLLTLIIGSDIGRTPNTPRPACRGYLHKRTQSSLLKGWRKRWFVLRHDCCLYYYRNKRDEGKSRALSAVSLEGAVVEADSSLGKPFVFKCCPVSGTRVYYFCATSNQEMKRWVEAMGRAVHPITQNHVWVHVTRHNSSLPPLAIKNPECLGLLHQLDRNKDSWVQHYCVLKDACLYFYASIRSTCAIGGIYLHGYTVREQPLGSKRSTIELRPPSEEFKAFSLCAENANENKRWISAIKSSVGKWLPLHQAIQDYMSRPPEETRM